ncbi:hypothetical protein I3F60_13130 [Streptomyces sp. MUM 136J]|uniref:hypothetical protein n=1 Tax=Streptomyces sp. MUM 136J TaxID=2791992 RepID=UPI001F04E5F3|nr:hypothetical protein [Streptomyces sp. MUM 136J]MCH0570180.1 hypothetical protein [Streptomyces sp. MUM 136J]
MNPEVGYSYGLKNKRTGLCLTSADFSASTCATISPSVAGGQGRLARTWNVPSLDNGEYPIEQKVGGSRPDRGQLLQRHGAGQPRQPVEHRERRRPSDQDTVDSVYAPATG